MRFFSDNAAPVHPKVMEAIAAANRLDTAYDGDEWSQRLDGAFSDLFGTEVRGFWATTGTAANCLALAALCPPYRSILCHKDAHIEVDEAGAPGFFTGGAKLVLLGGEGAKVTVEAAATACDLIRKDVHQVQPAALSVTNATESGLVYRAAEMAALGQFARERRLGFHLDGARIANAVASTGDSLADLTWRAGVDAMSFGFVKNGGMNAEALIYDTSFPPEPKLLMLAYKRLREIDVPEMMASIITETEGKPWSYTRDMTRQLWDEARHAMMGEVLFADLGVDWPALVRVNFTWSLGLNTQIGALERHAVLYFIEQGLMPRHGKRYEWEVAQAAGSPLAITFQDYDWADEVLHARIGKQWYVSAMPSQTEALRAGDRAWSTVLMDYGAWQRDGLTQHENWWPALYADACRRLGWTHDPRVAAFDISYAEQRADLKSVSHSG